MYVINFCLCLQVDYRINILLSLVCFFFFFEEISRLLGVIDCAYIKDYNSPISYPSKSMHLISIIDLSGKNGQVLILLFVVLVLSGTIARSPTKCPPRGHRAFFVWHELWTSAIWNLSKVRTSDAYSCLLVLFLVVWFHTYYCNRPGVPEPIRMVLVKFRTKTDAMNAFITKNRSFCLNNQVSMRVLQ